EWLASAVGQRVQAGPGAGVASGQASERVRAGVVHGLAASRGEEVRQRSGGGVRDRDGARGQGPVVVGGVEQAVADRQGDLCLQIQWRVEWFVVEHFLDERSDQNVLVPTGQRGQGLGPLQDVGADTSGEVLVHLAGADQQVGQRFATV